MFKSYSITFEKAFSFRISSFLTCEMGRLYNKTTTNQNVQELAFCGTGVPSTKNNPYFCILFLATPALMIQKTQQSCRLNGKITIWSRGSRVREQWTQCPSPFWHCVPTTVYYFTSVNNTLLCNPKCLPFVLLQCKMYTGQSPNKMFLYT